MKHFIKSNLRFPKMLATWVLLTVAVLAGIKAYAQPAGTLITLNLAAPTYPTSFPVDAQKGYWSETYSNNYPYIEFGLFKLSHLIGGMGGTDVGGGMSYWDGFTYCTSGDKTNYGEVGNSSGWVPYQWGNMAEGGIVSDEQGNPIKDGSGNVTVQKGIPYLVAYWGYYMEMFNNAEPCLQVHLNDGKSYEAIGVYINNHPWPFYGNIYGDGFARPFVEGDYFKLYIHGLNEKLEDTGASVEHTLAEYRNGQLVQSEEWEWVDLSGLGLVHGFYFTMETTDNDPIYGPNTAVYFCMDKLQVKVPGEELVLERPSSLTTVPSETTINFTWEHDANGLTVDGYNLYLDDVLVATVTEKNYQFTGLTTLRSYKISVEAFGNNLTSEKASVTASTIDETAPTTPDNFTGSATLTSIELNWTASTDNVAVVGYNVYLNGVRKKKVTGTSYTLTNLTPATNYTVEVDAVDETGNKSVRASLPISTIDEISPTAPSNLVAVANEKSVTLSWTESTDNLGVTGYNIYNETILIGTTIETSITVENLIAGSGYTFSVQAFDVAGNVSAKVSISATTTDETAPTAPINLVAQAAENAVTLSWATSTDNVAVTGYRVYNGNELIETTAGTSFTVSNLDAATQYTFTVEAFDATGNISEKVSVSAITTDETAPSAPTNLVAVPNETTVALSWDASTDNVAVAGYNIKLNGELIETTTATSYSITGLDVATGYSLSIEAFDSAGNVSEKSKIVVATTDNTPPSIPEIISALPGETIVELNWTASADNDGIAGYNIYLEDVLVGTSTDTAYTATNLNPATQHVFSVEAFDKSGNKSGKAIVTTHTTDQTPPTAPTRIVANIYSTTVILSWAESTDNVEVVAYNIYHNDVFIGTSATNNYTIPDVEEATVYTFSIQAVDAAGNISEATSIALSTTDETTPSAPTNLVAEAAENAVTLSWTASTDNVAVAGYRIFNGYEMIETTVGTSFTVSNLDAATQYTFRVEAFDAAGNVSKKVSVSATTTDESVPTAPSNLKAQSSETSVILTWSASTDNVSVAGYRIFNGYELIETTSGTSFTVSNLDAATQYTFSVEAFDAAGNVSEKVSVSATTTDETAPTTPSNVTAQAAETSITLSWTASTDNVTVTGYSVYNGSELIGNTTSSSFTLNNLEANNEYTFSVEAFDAAGNISEKASLIVSTLTNGTRLPLLNTISVYPNPFADFIIVDASFGEQAEIFNTQGQVVGKFPLFQGCNQINTSHLPSGVYTIKTGTSSKKITK